MQRPDVEVSLGRQGSLVPRSRLFSCEYHQPLSKFQIVAKYLAERGSLTGKTVLELGSGTGLVGLVAAMLGARVYITDQLYAMDPTRHIIYTALASLSTMG